MVISVIVIVGYHKSVTLFVESTVAAVLQFTVAVFGYFMVVWSYYKTNFTRPSRIPQSYHLTDDEFKLLDLQQGILYNEYSKYLADAKGIPRRCHVCIKCRTFVPPRAHHCRMCKRCVLRMDHHCPFFGNCIHFGNTKFFILTLSYATATCIFISIALFLIHGGNPQDDPKISLVDQSGQYLMYAAFSLAMAVSVANGSFLCYCLWHVLHNTTPIEAFVAMKNKTRVELPYDLGPYENWKQVFGPVKLAWFVPLHSTMGDGLSFRKKSKSGDIVRSHTIIPL